RSKRDWSSDVCSSDLKHLLHLLWRGGELHPFAHQVALVVLAQVGDEGGEGIVLVIFIMGHSDTSLQFQLGLPFVGRRRIVFPHEIGRASCRERLCCGG